MENFLLGGVFKETWNLFRKNVLFILSAIFLSCPIFNRITLLLDYQYSSQELAAFFQIFVLLAMAAFIFGWLKIFLDLAFTGKSAYSRFLPLSGYARFIIGTLAPFIVVYAGIFFLSIAVGAGFSWVVQYFNLRSDFISPLVVLAVELLLASPLLLFFFVTIHENISFFDGFKRSYQLASIDYKTVVFIGSVWYVNRFFNKIIIPKIELWFFQTYHDSIFIFLYGIGYLFYAIFIYQVLGLLVAVLYKKLMELQNERESSIY